jgi:hypothetical protein
LEINKEVDERYNVEMATEAACRYLKESYSKYRNWTLSAASYNYGLNGVDKQISRQETSNYYNLYLNEETYRFVARILAVKEILRNPKKFGFDIKAEELYPQIPVKRIIVKSGINDLVQFAAKNEINYKILKILNPWLRDKKLTNITGKRYTILIPENEEFLLENE